MKSEIDEAYSQCQNGTDPADIRIVKNWQFFLL